MKRRMLALLLALCLVFSNLAVGASAKEVIISKRPIGASAEKVVASSGTVGADAYKTSQNVTPVDALDVDLKNTEVPAHIQELRKAAEVFAADEVVNAYVVMEEAPLADTYTSKAQVSSAQIQQKLQKQNNVIAAIESSVLGGASLSVRYQFAYLTNSFSIETEFGNLEKIAALDGVKSVFVMPVYNAVPTNEVSEPNTAGSAAMTGVDLVWENLGYTGKGMKIAIIDTGLDLDHPSFAAAPAEASMTAADITAVLNNLNVKALRSSTTAAELYRSAKVPFAFNYADRNLIADHSRDNQSDHGTHVSGIAAANELASTEVKGMAPDAQVIVMKVFGATRAGYDDDIVAALEDAMTLGCDVVNLSLGSPAGFTTTDTEIDLIYERLAEQEIVACISAGNEDHSGDAGMWADYSRTVNPDNGTVGEPGVYHNVLTVASADNAATMGNYFSVGSTKFFYQDTAEYLQGETSSSLRNLAGRQLEYVIVDGLGEVDDFYAANGTSLVRGKVAVVMRGDLSFSNKVENAEAAGAVACIIWNHNDDDDIFSFGMVTSNESTGYMPRIPAALISLTDGNRMEQATSKVMVVASEMAMRVDRNGGKVSDFSSWGVAPDLTLEPDITGVGGNVYSTRDYGSYGLMSGTSMSAPQLAGISALMMERLHEEYPNATAGTLRTMAEAILMSTANPIWDEDAESSPRRQGAGLVDAYQALNSDTYLTVNGGKPKASLGDSTTGNYSFTFRVHNKGTESVTYRLSGSVNTEVVASADISATEVEYFMYGEDMPLNATTSFSRNTVTVPAGSTADVTVSISLTADDKAYFAECWENGGYVDGYVYLRSYTDEGALEEQLNMPFLGFYGDWTEAPVFDTMYWYDNTAWGLDSPTGLPEGDMYPHIVWTGEEDMLGFNPYSGPVSDENDNIIYDPSHNVVSPNRDGYVDGIEDMYLSLMRGAKTLTLDWTVDGELMHRDVTTNNSKTMYMSNYGQVIPWVYSWYSYNFYDFTDEDGQVLPSGTEVLLTIRGEVDYGDGGEHSIQIPFVVDTAKPELVNASIQAMSGRNVLTITATDDVALAAVAVLNSSGSSVLGMAYDFEMEQNDDGSYTAYFDVSGMGSDFVVAVCDYGCNERFYEINDGSSDGDPTDPEEPGIPGTDPEVWVGGVGLADGDFLAVGATEATRTQPSGGYAFYEDGYLTLCNYSYTGVGSYYDQANGWAAIIYADVPLTIVLEGENSLTQTGSMSESVYLPYGGSVVGSGNMTTSGGFYSMWSDMDGADIEIMLNGGSWTARNCEVAFQNAGVADFYIFSGTVDVEGNRYGLTTNGTGYVLGGDVSLKALSDDNVNYCAVKGSFGVASALTIQASVDPNGPLGDLVPELFGTYHWIKITDPNGAPEEPEEPSEPEEPEDPETGYVLYVGGVGMTNGDYLAVGASATTRTQPSGGYAYYSGGKLYFHDYSYRGVGWMYHEEYQYSAIVVSWVGLEIVLEGENTLTQTDDEADHVFVTGELIITGSGTMTTNNGYFSIWSGTGSDTVAFDMDGGSWIARNVMVGMESGVAEVYSGTVDVEAEMYGFACDYVSVYGGDVSLKAFSTYDPGAGYIPPCALVGELTVADGLDVQASVNVNGPLGEFNVEDQWDYHWVVIGEASESEDPSEPTEPEDPEDPVDTDVPSVIRLAGANRYATAFAVADELKARFGVEKFESVVVAYGQNFPDALTGSYLAAVKSAPILLTDSTLTVQAEVGQYILQNVEAGGTVYILGGSSAVSEEFEVAMRLARYNVVRLKGAGRYETNLAILEEAGVNKTDEILIATGTNYADSLSASATGLPMLLVSDKLTDAQKSFLYGTSRKFVILGGTGAVSAEIEAELASIGTVTRVKGSSRYGTSVAIAERYFTNPEAAVLAYAQGFPDGLCGGPLAISMGAPLILTSNDAYQIADAYVSGISTGAVTGGTSRISDDVVREIFDLSDDTPIIKPRRFQGHTYCVFDDSSIRTWEAAKEYCESIGGYMAVIGSQEENDALYTYIKNQKYDVVNFGYSDAEEEGEWKWVPQEQSTYTNWHESQPNDGRNGNYAQFATTISGVPGNGQWSDGYFGGYLGYAFICEWPGIE